MAETQADDAPDHSPGDRAVSRFRGLGMALLVALMLPLLAGCGTLRTARALAHAGDPLTPQEHIQLGVAYEQSGEYGAAMKQFEAAAARLKRDPVPRTNIANIYVLQEDLAAAEANYRQAITYDSTYAPALNNLGWLLLQRQGDLAEAESLVQRALEQDPENVDYQDTLAQIQQAAGEGAGDAGKP